MLCILDIFPILSTFPMSFNFIFWKTSHVFVVSITVVLILICCPYVRLAAWCFTHQKCHPRRHCQSISNSLNQSAQAVSVSRCVNTLPTGRRGSKHLPRPHTFGLYVLFESRLLLLRIQPFFAARLPTYDFCASTHRQFLSPAGGGRLQVGVAHLSYSNLKFNLLAS